ncbi:uncharacterized protein LOC128260746 [Drosophila gunungcola]|uniref:uncharacterized protein LOC128260746 n=1 Tax=Drosophila gunungcola TaxID=103775 RepID=UPI0022E6490B|nr:uncharacterized protein LOC128260746 [Drosophila gunungcola]
MEAGQELEDIVFLFDIVVTKLELYKPVEEPEKCEVLVKFAGNNVKLTPSRVNVSDFVGNRKTEFISSPSQLRNTLESQGVQMNARYEGSSLGSNVMLLPDTFIDKISSTMCDLFYEDTILLMRRTDCTGTLSILLSLIVKCTDQEIPREPRRSSSRRSSRKSSTLVIVPKKVEQNIECQGLGPTFNAHDVLFVVGNPDPLLKIPSEPCPELPPEEGDERLDLDLQRYRSLQNRRVIFPDDDPCPKEKPSLVQLKNLTDDFSKIIGLVTDKVKRLEVPTTSVVDTETPSERTAATPSTYKETPEEQWIPVPLKEDAESDVKPIRFCPVCLYSMSWLPKYTPCPRCNTKARPVRKGHPKNILTADEIVAEQLLKPKQLDESDDFFKKPCQEPILRIKKVKKKKQTGLGEPVPDSDSDEECPPCRCTCTVGKICAHCRVRKLCEEIFEGETQMEPERHKRMEVPQPCFDDDFCVIAEPIDDRPFLTRVFSELKSLYSLHDAKKLLAIQKRCESQTLLPFREARSSMSFNLSRGVFNPHIPGTFGRQTAGHKSCLPMEHPVPRRHGWNWPRSREARKQGWRPGSILRAAVRVMRFFLMPKEDRNLCQKISNDNEKQERCGLPVLNVCKKDGVIFVTLRPLAALDITQKPITFRIVRSDLAVALRQIKRALKDQGFEKCTCHKSLMLCTCRDALDKFLLNKALKKECQRRIMEPCPEHLVLTDTSVSDLEFDLDVTPPAGTQWPEQKALRNVVNHGTQTELQNKITIRPSYPLQDSPYWRAYDCAAGDRYMGTAMGSNVETVFEDGIYGYMGGGQHGRAPVWRDPRVWGSRSGAPMPIGTAPSAIDPYRFTKTVWKGLPKKIINQMRKNRKQY